jgi:hypothetical protein
LKAVLALIADWLGQLELTATNPLSAANIPQLALQK